MLHKKENKKMNIKNKLFKIIGIFLILFLSVQFILMKINNKKYIDISGYTFFRVITGSMENEIMVGDIVVIKLTKDVNLNDIIAYNSDDNEMILHRIVNMTNENITTKGDANNSEDKPINIRKVIGKKVFVIKKKVIIIALCLFFCAILCMNFFKRRKK